MKNAEFKNSRISNFTSSVINISFTDINLHVDSCIFSYLSSETPGCAIFCKSQQSIVEKVCGFHCTSRPYNEPGGIFFYIYTRYSIQKLNKIYMISASDMNYNYSTISLNSSKIIYSNINVTKSSARSCPGYYLGLSSGTLDATGSYVSVTDCISENEVIFNQQGSHKLTNANIINSTCKNVKNGLYRSWCASSTLTNVIFRDNNNYLLIAANVISKIFLVNCYFPSNAQRIGSGTLSGNPVGYLATTHKIRLTNCVYVRFCTIKKKKNKEICTPIMFSLVCYS